MTVEEFFKHRGWSGTQHLYKDAEDYGKMCYNQAIDDILDKSLMICDLDGCSDCEFHHINREKILKLKKVI